MNWQELHQHFDQAFNFFDRIGVSSSLSQQSVPVHPLIKLSTGLALKTLSNQENRLVILLPNRLQSARWIATFCTLEVMRNDYKANSSVGLEFSRGQKLKVNNCVVEFDGEEFSHNVNQWVMRVKCSNGLYSIPLDRKLKFQPADTKRPLSTLEKVKAAYYSSEILNNQLDSILGIKTQGNRAIFEDNIILVSKIGETQRFITENYINKRQIVELFPWGKVDIQGSVTALTWGQIRTQPSALIASDLYGTTECLSSQPFKTKGIIIDGVASCVKDLQRLDDNILHLNIPTIVIADLFETELLHHLEGRDFKIWQWNKNNLSESRSVILVNRENPFASLNHSLTNYTQQQLIVEGCEYPQLTELVDSILELSKAISPEDDQLQTLYSQLIKLVNELSRVIWLPDNVWITNFLDRLYLLQASFAKEKKWMTDNVVKVVDTGLSTLAELASSLFSNSDSKTDKLRRLFNSLSYNDTLAIVVPHENDAEAARQYWQNELPARRFIQLHFLPVSELRDAGEMGLLTQLVVCGWLNHSRMYPLLHLHIAPKITALLYPFEIKWFKNAQRRWQKQNNYHIRAKDFSNTLKLSESSLKFVDFSPDTLSLDPIPKQEKLDIIDFELKLKRYRYAVYVATDTPTDQIVRAKTIVFTQNRFAFITETHRLLVINDLIRGKNAQSGIHRRDLRELKGGDYVLFRESDKDIIREIADKFLVERNLGHLREVASLWKVPLQEKYEAYGFDLDRLTLLLWDAGCEREPSTIKNWLFDDDQIGPKNENDTLKRIAKATRNNMLLDKITEVEEAIKKVRNAHRQAATYITEKLLMNLSKILDSEVDSYTSFRESMTLDLDDFGQIKILRIEEILDEWKSYNINLVNRLLP